MDEIGEEGQLGSAYRESLQRVFREIVTPERWAECVEGVLEQAARGNVPAFKQLEAWAMGKPSDQADGGSATDRDRTALSIVITHPGSE